MLKKPDHKPKPVVLCILDGWGYAEPGPMNAISRAATPTYDRWWKTCPRAFLDTSGEHVGLPDGQMGNSEVGHMNIGGGRVVKTDLPRIGEAMADGTFETFPDVRDTIKTLKANGGALHILGLLSIGGVHSHQDHIIKAAEVFSGAGIEVWVHAFMDGRDVPPTSGLGYVKLFENHFRNNPRVKIATVSGRFFAMDRDHRWERVEKAYAVIGPGLGRRKETAQKAVEDSYSEGATDEFVTPVKIGDYKGMKKGDALFMANFRADRAREILTALVDPGFSEFPRGGQIDFCSRLGMTEYSDNLSRFIKVLFPPVEVPNSLGEVVSKAGMTQLRIAETEKYAHVTFFFNGGQEQVFKGEERILIPSPKVKTYDLKPEMSAFEVTERLEEEILSGKFDLIVVNYANPDMVGHTGKLPAAIAAVETIDTCLGKLEAALEKAEGVMLVSADHGNVEQMQDPVTRGPHTAHTTFRVPVILVDPAKADPTISELRDGKLADLAPSVLDLLELPKPRAMTGSALFIRTGTAP